MLVWTMVPGVLAALAFAVLVKPDRTQPAAPPQRFWKSLGALPPRFKRFLVAVFLFGIGDFARTLLILRATQLLTPEWGATRAMATAMALYVGHNIVYSAASYPVGWLADRIEPQRLLFGGYLLGTLTAGLAAMATPSLPLLAALFTTAGLTLAFEDTLEGTLTAAEVPTALRGTGYGMLATVNGLGDLLSSSLVGLLWSTVSPAFGFGTATVLCLLGTAALALHSRGAPRAGGQS
jgi:MFS family permease